MNSKVSPNWTIAPLSDVAVIVMGQSPDSSTYNGKGNGLPFFQGKAEFGALYPSVRKWCSAPTKIAESGDILLSVRAPVGPTNLAPEQCCIGRGLAAIRAYPPLDQKYLLHHFRSIEPWLSEQGTGTTFKAISGEFIRSIEISLAPLNEQRRIADKLNQTLAIVERALARLRCVPEILKRFRQSVLAAATDGRLTEDWRSIYQVEGEWGEVTLADIGELGRGKSKHRPRNDPKLYGGPHPFIQTGDIAQSNGLISSHSQTYSDFGLAQSKLWPAGTVCITIAANIADTAILSYAACFPDSVVGFVAATEKALPQFVKWSIDVMKDDLESFAPATAQKNINLAVLNALRIRCPELAEQTEIVRRVEALFALADRIETRHQAALARAEKLAQALLAKAFRGELVPQDPADEPAAALLARIRAARQSASTKPRRKKNTKIDAIA